VSERIENLRRLIERGYNCKARHSSSTPVLETFNGETVWDGVVETFEVDGYPTVSRCYAFQFVQNDQPEIKTVLGVAGIDSPLKALRFALAVQARGG
jgi:predicted nuclease with TOPRIM domain